MSGRKKTRKSQAEMGWVPVHMGHVLAFAERDVPWGPGQPYLRARTHTSAWPRVFRCEQTDPGHKESCSQMHSACALGTHTCIHIYVRCCSRKPVLQTSVNKQMAPQHCNFTTLQLLLCSCSKHFLAYYMKKGGYHGFAKLYISYLICLLNTFGVEGGKSISIF